MLGSRPAATSWKTKSSEAPSSISIVTRRSMDAGSISATAGGRAGKRRLARRPARDHRRDDRQHDGDRQHRGADASATAAEMRQTDDQEHHAGSGHERGANEHALARFTIEDVAEAEQVEPHQPGAGRRRDRAEPRQQPHAEPTRRQHFNGQDLAQDNQRVEQHGEVRAVGNGKHGGQRQQRDGFDRNRWIELQEKRGEISGCHAGGDHRIREHSKVTHETVCSLQSAVKSLNRQSAVQSSVSLLYSYVDADS